jgi:hypothetical protein
LKQIRRHLTYANVMSSFAVFLILGGATAFAAIKKVGANEIKANSIKTGKIVKEAVTAGKIKNGAVTETKLGDGAVTTNKLADNAVTTPKIAKDAVSTEKIAKDAVSTEKIAKDAVTTEKILDDAVTGAKVKESTLGQVPSAANAASLGGIAASGYARRFFARVAYTTSTPSIIASSPGIAANGEGALGFPRIIFPQSMDSCSVIATPSSGAGAQMIRRSTTVTGAQVQFGVFTDAGAATRVDFDVIAVC